MYRGTLPGFHWDDAKRKYFRLEPGHAALPAGQAHTREEVRRRECGEKTSLIRRSPVLDRPSLLQSEALREIGHGSISTTRRRGDRVSAIVQSYAQHTALELAPAGSRPKLTITHFDVDERSQALVAGTWDVERAVASLFSCLPDDDVDDDVDDVDRTPERVDSQQRSHHGRSTSTYHCGRELDPMFGSPLTGLSINPATLSLACSSRGTGPRTRATLQIGGLVEREDMLAGRPLDTGVGARFQFYDPFEINCAAINPARSESSQETIAVGCSDGHGVKLFGAERPPTGSGRDWQFLDEHETHADVLALDWLGENLLVAGMRDSSILLYDVRARSGVRRLKHASAVVGIRRGDSGERFVVAGVASNMALYDLRALRTSDAAPSRTGARSFEQKQRHRASASRRSRPSSASRRPRPSYHQDTQQMPTAQPLLTFPYSNDVSCLGLDVEPALGLVAAGEEGGFVRVSSLTTGRTVKRWEPQTGSGENTSAVKFTRSADGVVKVMAACGSRIVEWCW